MEGVGQRDFKYRPWKGQSFPEKLEVQSSVVSEACIFGLCSPRTFLVGSPMRIEGEVRNTGNTPMPSEGPAGPGCFWELVVKIGWSDGRSTSLPTRFTEQLKPGNSVRFGPHRPSVVAPGFFRAELTHSTAFRYIAPAGTDPSGDYGRASATYGEETLLLKEGTALDTNAIYTRVGVLIAAATLTLVILGLLLGRRV